MSFPHTQEALKNQQEMYSEKNRKLDERQQDSPAGTALSEAAKDGSNNLMAAHGEDPMPTCEDEGNAAGALAPVAIAFARDVVEGGAQEQAKNYSAPDDGKERSAKDKVLAGLNQHDAAFGSDA